jgi:hypothetical protein
MIRAIHSRSASPQLKCQRRSMASARSDGSGGTHQ